MDAERALEILNRQLNEISSLRNQVRFSRDFKKWQRDTEIAIEKIFSVGSRNAQDFQGIAYTPSTYSMDNPDPAFNKAFLRGLESAEAVLASMMDELRNYELHCGLETGFSDSLSLVEKICRRFNQVARQLKSRREQRPTISIVDEYDVQDLLHALLRVHFDDIRPEEWTPSYAGRSSRVDFLLKEENIVVEVKKTRAALKDAQIGEQLLVDIAR